MDRAGRYLSFVCHGVAIACFLFLCVLAGALGGALTRQTHWPYVMQARQFLTPEVEPGGSILVLRQIKYLEDCELDYTYRVQSRVEPDRRSETLSPVHYDHPPWDLDGVPKTNAYRVSASFPCGSAYFVESPTAACTWWQRMFRWTRLKKDDITTNFTVVNCPSTN